MPVTKIQLISLAVLYLATLLRAEPLVLTDKTWKDMLCGQWMVEFYAPWCPSCQYFSQTWADFAKAMVTKEVKVGAIDINEYPSLSGRFRISVLPTIYYVREGVFRQYNGERSLHGLKKYIENQEWQQTEPISSYFAPDSFVMSMISKIFDLSIVVKDAYTILKDQYGWPSWVIYIFFTFVLIFVALVLGFTVLMIIDFCVTGTVKDTNNIPDDSKDVEDWDENDLDKSLKQKKPTGTVPTFIASSTPQRPSNKNRSSPVLEMQDDEALFDEVLANDQNENDDSEGFDASERIQGSDEEDQVTDAVLRKRPVQ